MFASHPSSPGVVYALSSPRGVLKSTDAGLNWKLSNTGLTLTQFNFIAIAHTDPRILWLTDRGAPTKARIVATAGRRSGASRIPASHWIHSLPMWFTLRIPLYGGW